MKHGYSQHKLYNCNINLKNYCIWKKIKSSHQKQKG